VKVLFDNCVAPLLATTLHGYISHFQHSAFHLKDVPGLENGRSSTDVEWIEHLRHQSDEWIFISGDGRVLKNAAERAALRSAGLHGFILAPAYQKTPLNQVAATLLWKWPEIEQVTRLLAAPSMHEIPIGKNTKLRQLPI
jgi:PIN like domain